MGPADEMQMGLLFLQTTPLWGKREMKEASRQICQHAFGPWILCGRD